jgi:hypothetical protein
VTCLATVVTDVSLVVPVLLGVFVRSAPITLSLHMFDIRTSVLLRFVAQVILTRCIYLHRVWIALLGSSQGESVAFLLGFSLPPTLI